MPPLGGCDVETGVCEDLCTAVDCEDGSFCNTETGECVDRDIANCEACDDESDCPDGYWCIRFNDGRREIARYCGAGCEDDICPENFRCVDLNRNGRQVRACAPEQGVQQCFECQDDGDCEGDLNVCRGFECQEVECTEDDQCEGDRGVCRDNACLEVECVNDEQCEGELACRQNECVEVGANRVASEWDREGRSWDDKPPCNSADDCQPGEECGGFANDRFCRLPCDNENLCPNDFRCCDIRGFSDFCVPEQLNDQNFCR